MRSYPLVVRIDGIRIIPILQITITWSWLDPKYRNIENFKILAQKLNVIGEQINSAGLGFAYHNHGFEFENHNGENGYDIIISDTDPSLVKFQIDMYWVMHAATTTPK